MSSATLKMLLFFVEITAWIAAVIFALRGSMAVAAVTASCALAADVTGRIWSRKSPVPMPHSMSWVLRVPRGPHSPKRLHAILRPRSGERMLEIGPGIGTHALPVAASLLPDGALDVLDVQQEMLDRLQRSARSVGLRNIVATRGDARRLPYADHVFDAAYLISVLGEIPDRETALAEVRRVLKPGGRLVVGEIVVDPDYVWPSRLKHEAETAGFRVERIAGPRLAYLALLRPAR